MAKRKNKDLGDGMVDPMNNDPMSRTNVERNDRHMRGGARGDHAAGNEGIDDPAMAQTQREAMDGLEAAGTSTRMTTGNRMEAADTGEKEDAASGEKMPRSSEQHTERGTDNDRQQGREETDNNSGDFSGQGGQKEGKHSGAREEGTGYTRESSTDDSDAENPLV